MSTPSINHSRTSIEIVKLLGLACIFITGAVVGRSNRRGVFLFQALEWMSLLYGLWAFVSFVAFPDTFMGVAGAEWSNRLKASFLSANTAGAFFGMTLILGVGLLIDGFQRVQRPRDGRSGLDQKFSAAAVPGGLALIAATALLLTASRTAISVTGATLLAFITVEGITLRWRLSTFLKVLAPIVLFAAPLVLVLSGTAFFQRLSGLEADAKSRSLIYALNNQATAPYPLMGFGLGTFEEIHRQLLNKSDFSLFWNIRAMHNVYLQWRQGAGWLGATPIFLAVTAALARIAAATTIRSGVGTHLRIIIAMSAILVLHGLTDFALEEFSVAGFWSLLLGCGVAMASNRR